MGFVRTMVYTLSGKLDSYSFTPNGDGTATIRTLDGSTGIDRSGKAFAAVRIPVADAVRLARGAKSVTVAPTRVPKTGAPNAATFAAQNGGKSPRKPRAAAAESTPAAS